MLENIHPHSLAVDEAVLQGRVVGMSPAKLDPLLPKGFRQHLFKSGLCGPADFIGRLAQITVRNQNKLILREGSGIYDFRN